MLQVLIAEDHQVVRSGIRAMLALDQEIDIVAEVASCSHVPEFISAGGKVDIILTGIDMSEPDGFSIFRQMKLMKLPVHIVVISFYDSEPYVLQAFIEGASGYLLTNVSPGELAFSLRYVCLGHKYLCTELSLLIIGDLAKTGLFKSSAFLAIHQLSILETEIIFLSAKGLNVLEIAYELGVTQEEIWLGGQTLFNKSGPINKVMLTRYPVLNAICVSKGTSL